MIYSNSVFLCPRPFEHLVDDGEENVAVFLTADQRANLIAHSSRPLAALLTGYTGELLQVYGIDPLSVAQ